MVDLVADEHARTILAAASANPRTAQELADECRVSLPTVYRKVNMLQDHGFLNENIRIVHSGDHQKEYETVLEQVCLAFDDGAFEANVQIQRDFVEKFSSLWRDLERSGREFGW